MTEPRMPMIRRKLLALFAFLIGILFGPGLLWQWTASKPWTERDELLKLYKPMSGNSANKKYALEMVNGTAMAGMTCQQCDEMFQECVAEVDPDAPLGYEIRNVLD
jgi:hypothetical protein